MEQRRETAARAYLKASQESKDKDVATAYLEMAKSTLEMQTTAANTSKQLSFGELESTFSKEVKDANDWYAKVRADELKWIAAEVDVDAEFTNKYYENGSPSVDVSGDNKHNQLWLFAAVAAVVLGLLLLYFRTSQKRALESQ